MKIFYTLLIYVLTCGYSIAQNKIETFIIADSLINNVNLEAAEEKLHKLCQDNPYNGFYNYLLGINYHQKGEYNLSNTLLRKAQKLNWHYLSSYLLAKNYSSINHTDSALYFLKEYSKTPFKGPPIRSVLNDTVFCGLRNLPEFQFLFPTKIDVTTDKKEGWMTDIEYLEYVLMTTHFNPYFKLAESEWKEKIAKLKKDLPKLTNDQVLVRVAKFIASMGDAHTRILSFDEYNTHFGNRELPFDVQIFEDGCFIVRASKEYSFLLGAKLLNVNQFTFEEVYKLVSTLIPNDNEMWCKREFNSYFKNTNFLSGLEIIQSNKDSLTIEYEIHNQAFKKKVALKNMDKNSLIDFHSYYSLKRPMYLKNKFNPYWYKYDEDSQILYFQLNSITSKKENSIEDFCDSLKNICKNKSLNAFILDIRLNTGGGSHHNKTILKLLISENINIRGKLFLVIGRSTFSAAQNLTSDIEYYTDAIFIGEQTGSSPNFIGEINPFTLPFSGLVISSSDVYHQRGLYSSDIRKWKAPDIYIPNSFADFKNGIDPVIDEIMKYINE